MYCHRFHCIEVEFLRSGHSHAELDARFSAVAAVLSAAPTLEDEDDFVGWLTTHLKPVGNRKIIIETLGATFDFKKVLNKAGVHITGLAATHAQPLSNHVWRIIPRSIVSQVGLTDAAITCGHADWQAEDDPRDAVLMVKQHMSDRDFSQEPVLLLPVSAAKKIEDEMADLKFAEPLTFTEETLRQFRKTSSAIEREPWQLIKGSHYLRSLVDNAENPYHVPDNVFKLKFIKEYSLKAPSMQPVDLPPHVKAMGLGEEVRRVQVAAQSAAEVKRRMKDSERQTPTTAGAAPKAKGATKKRLAADAAGAVLKRPAAPGAKKRPAAAVAPAPHDARHEAPGPSAPAVLPESLAAPAARAGAAPGPADSPLPEDDDDMEPKIGEWKPNDEGALPAEGLPGGGAGLHLAGEPAEPAPLAPAPQGPGPSDFDVALAMPGPAGDAGLGFDPRVRAPPWFRIPNMFPNTSKAEQRRAEQV